MRITELLISGEDVVHAMQASHSIREACGNTVWKHRLLNDMPYLYELSERIVNMGSGADRVDWKEAYGRMMVQSQCVHQLAKALHCPRHR